MNHVCIYIVNSCTKYSPRRSYLNCQNLHKFYCNNVIYIGKIVYSQWNWLKQYSCEIQPIRTGEMCYSYNSSSAFAKKSIHLILCTDLMITFYMKKSVTDLKLPRLWIHVEERVWGHTRSSLESMITSPVIPARIINIIDVYKINK